MLENIKSWLFDESGEDNQQESHQIKNEVVRWNVNNIDQLDSIGDDFKNHKIIVCTFNYNVIKRALDFISGLCYVLQYQDIKINDDTYMFLPSYISYESKGQ